MTDELTLRAQLESAWARSDSLFAMLAPDAFALRPIALRHPLLFYVGHLPAFAHNQIVRGALGGETLDPALDDLFARGIDPETEGEAPSIAQWPSIASVLAYRDAVRARVRQSIAAVLERPHDVLCANGRVLSLVIEHELMHHETLQYLFAQCPDGTLSRPQHHEPIGGAGRAAVLRSVGAGFVTLGARFDELAFGWDNEFGATRERVESFLLSDLPVRNRDWLDYMGEVGSSDDHRPASMVERDGRWFVRTVFGLVPMDVAEGWPVQVSALQARAYCARVGGRLATEAELHHAARATMDREDFTAHALLQWERWYPDPVGHAPASASAFGVEELIGNGWEWTSSVFAPREGFTPWARTYPGYSADFFDGEHDVVFGGAWPTDLALVRPSFCNWYRRSYPYAFTSFRVARDR